MTKTTTTNTTTTISPPSPTTTTHSSSFPSPTMILPPLKNQNLQSYEEHQTQMQKE